MSFLLRVEVVAAYQLAPERRFVAVQLDGVYSAHAVLGADE